MSARAVYGLTGGICCLALLVLVTLANQGYVGLRLVFWHILAFSLLAYSFTTLS